ncbi:glycosyltransferase [bacterium]|nr:glycosyltransferase [bacterium]
MEKVSILMSIYNEKENEVRQSLYSLLNQTYRNIEIIIVVDNPTENDKYKKILESFLFENKKIKVLYNELNIGLAMSMNKAFNISQGKYIARMDADDVADANRIEKEVSIIENGKYDFICTGFEYIDENNNQIPGTYIHYTPDTLKRTLITTNCIHHPTVLMKRSLFKKVGGYRNFPCSQDYDLWLRLLESKCNFYMINEPLLKYRIRTDSTTNRNRFLQACTLYYISQLFYQRIKFKNDDYSIENYDIFIKICHEKYRFHRKNIKHIQRIQKKLGFSLFLDVILRCYLFLISKFIRDNYLLKYKVKKSLSYRNIKESI